MKRWIYPEENYHKILRVMAKGEERESKILRDPTVIMTQPTHFGDSPLYRLAQNHMAKQTGHRKAAITQQGRDVLTYLDKGYAWDVKQNKPDQQRGLDKQAEKAHQHKYAFTTGPQRNIAVGSQKHHILSTARGCNESGKTYNGTVAHKTAIQQLIQNDLLKRSSAHNLVPTERGLVALEILDNRFNVNTIRGIDTRIPKENLERELHYVKAWFEQGNTGQTNTKWYGREPELESIKEALEFWAVPVQWLRKNKQYADNDKVIMLYDETQKLLKQYSNGTPAFVSTLKDWIDYEKHGISKGLTGWESVLSLATQVFDPASTEVDEVKKYFMQVKLSN
jgi:hypothetical protein